MTTTLDGLEFDPGFAPYILAFRGTVEYLYFDINKFKNFSQKKMKFRQYHKKILEVFYNNVGFYAGCLLWAAYIKSQPEQKLLSNHCLGQKYNEDENTSDTDYMINFVKLYPKDMKYFMAEEFSFDSKILKILDSYREFLILNKGFIDSKTNTDIVLPESLKINKEENYKEIIDEVLKTGKLEELIKYIEV